MKTIKIGELVAKGPAAWLEKKRRGRPKGPQALRSLLGIKRLPGPRRRQSTKPQMFKRVEPTRRSAEFRRWLRDKTYRNSDRSAIRFLLGREWGRQPDETEVDSSCEALSRYRRSIARYAKK